MSESMDEVLSQLRKRGYQARAVSASHISALQEEIDGRHRQGMIDDDFYRTRLGWFKFAPPEDFSPSSLIVVAVPRPQTQAIFRRKGRPLPLILPPTYTAYDEINKAIEDLLSKLLRGKGYRIARAALPLKILAARSGLSQYGRNNIAYVPGMGSFLQLVAVYSDMPCQRDTWQEPAMMESCAKCQLCRQACPTGAIPTDRFLLRAERCIVYHNEKPGNVPFPAWINPSWHNCIMGCMRCQRTCPIDREFLRWIEDKEEFSEEETSLLLKGARLDELPSVAVKKLEHLSLAAEIDRLPRNLGVFYKRGPS